MLGSHTHTVMVANFPIPCPMDCTGDISGNWDFFRSSWNDYKRATELDKKEMSIRVASFRSILGRDAQRILQPIPFASSAERKDLAIVITALENHFKPRRNKVFERYVLTLQFRNQAKLLMIMSRVFDV